MRELHLYIQTTKCNYFGNTQKISRSDSETSSNKKRAEARNGVHSFREHSTN